MTKLNGPLVLLSTFVCGTAMLAATDAKSEGAAFEMASYLDSPGGREVAAGDYAAAIAKATSGASHFHATSPLVASTNLCVAYTVTGVFEAAQNACAKAVTLAKRLDDMPHRRFARSTATSKALTNRGVLRAVSGDSAGAATDFRKAAAMRGADSAASRNLAYLESSPSYRLALLGAATE